MNYKSLISSQSLLRQAWTLSLEICTCYPYPSHVFLLFQELGKLGKYLDYQQGWWEGGIWAHTARQDALLYLCACVCVLIYLNHCLTITMAADVETSTQWGKGSLVLSTSCDSSNILIGVKRIWMYTYSFHPNPSWDPQNLLSTAWGRINRCNQFEYLCFNVEYSYYLAIPFPDISLTLHSSSIHDSKHQVKCPSAAKTINKL